MRADDNRGVRSKTLSVGVRAIPSVDHSVMTTYAERMEAIASQSVEAVRRADALRARNELGKVPIAIDRRPYVRTVHGDEHSNDGLIIGDQRSHERRSIDKWNAQQAYRHQLTGDIERNANTVTKPTNTEMTDRYNEALVGKVVHDSGFMIGKDVEIRAAERRIAAKHLVTQAQSDLNQKLELKNSLQLQLEKSQEQSDMDAGFQIGADEDGVRASHRAAQKMYCTQLLADRRSASQDIVKVLRIKEKVENEEYLNQTGWTGLQIGGFSSDGTKSMLQLHAIQKAAMQAQYRNALYEQQGTRARIEKEKTYPEIGTFSTSSVPYMR